MGSVGAPNPRLELAGRPAAGPRTSRRPCVRVRANVEETQPLFRSRVQKAGWTVPKQQALHPIAQEAWASIHEIYGGRCFETPLVPAPWLADRAEAAAVHLKAECRQASGSYRARGATHKLLALSSEQLQRGVVAAGSLNHTLAVLHAASAAAAQRGVPVPARIILPRSAPPARADKLRQLGGQVELAGGSEAEAEAEARAAAAAQQAAYIDAANDPQVAGGLGSIAIELLMQLPRGRLDAVFVPVGTSGGLASGIAAVLKAADPSIQVWGAHPQVVQRLRAILTAPKAGWEGGAEEVPAGMVDEFVSVTEEEVARAVIDTTTRSGMQVDAATGVAVAAFQKVASRLRGKHCVIIVCGGNMGSEGMQLVYEVAGAAGRA